ncbi:MAG: NAD(P)-dependent methylenetetrahydromethanopterin dehydrogenase [Gammaproteobacteria bacterium]
MEKKRSILHMFDPMPNNSPFDVNMALDAGFDLLMPYSNVKLDNISGLTQDAIFSRGPAGVKRTAIFIGGRDIGLAIDMLNAARQAMVPPFVISVLADPSGAFTTAAALVACVEKKLQIKHGMELSECKAVVFGGTGAVGVTTGVIASLAGVDTTLIDHLSLETSSDLAKAYNRRFGCALKAAVASTQAAKIELIADADIVFCTAKAGVQVLDAAALRKTVRLKIAADINAVPPLGIEGIKRSHFGEPLVHADQSPNAVGIGALAVGNVKYQLQNTLLKLLLESEEPLYLDFREAFSRARAIV